MGQARTDEDHPWGDSERHWFKRAVKAYGHTQEQCAAALRSLGLQNVKQSSVSKWLNGVTPGEEAVPILVEYCEGAGIPLDMLADDEKQEPNEEPDEKGAVQSQPTPRGAELRLLPVGESAEPLAERRTAARERFASMVLEPRMASQLPLTDPEIGFFRDVAREVYGIDLG